MHHTDHHVHTQFGHENHHHTVMIPPPVSSASCAVIPLVGVSPTTQTYDPTFPIHLQGRLSFVEFQNIIREANETVVNSRKGIVSPQRFMLFVFLLAVGFMGFAVLAFNTGSFDLYCFPPPHHKYTACFLGSCFAGMHGFLALSALCFVSFGASGFVYAQRARKATIALIDDLMALCNAKNQTMASTGLQWRVGFQARWLECHIGTPLEPGYPTPATTPFSSYGNVPSSYAYPVDSNSSAPVLASTQKY
eukprot:c9999_g1_i1.p1 GENE.c9999_g1_i1~~c9999_g1_i1.p1  ORF type:complete len:249 (-),score=39.65 c9999_g1_i1:136-882(-)